MLFHKITSTGLGIGYIGKGAGTAASIVTCLFLYIFRVGYFENPLISFSISILIVVLGVWSSGKVDHIWGKDHNRVVIDEVAGMCISLLFVPLSIQNIIFGLIFFRFFDILKPFYIRKLEALPKGWGVMADDILAGIYANIVLQILIVCKIL